MITITHTHADGTVAEGTSKGDKAGKILKENGFSFRYGAWRIRGSRDRMASWRIDAAARALRAAGFDVEVAIDNTPRPTEVVEAERAERAEARADRFAGYAENAAGQSQAAEAGARSIQKYIPFGQPVLVGHHSQRRHERDLERIDRGLRRSVEEDRKADHWAQRADSAEHSQQYRENIHVTLRRIDKLEADRRFILRNLDGEPEDSPYRKRITPRLAQLDDQIAYWKKHVAEAEAAGVKIWRQADFVKGDLVRDRFGWNPVLRVNPRSLTVPHYFIEGRTRPLPYDQVTGHRPAAEAESLAEE